MGNLQKRGGRPATGGLGDAAPAQSAKSDIGVFDAVPMGSFGTALILLL